jgi:hypothetical protein
MTQDLLNHLVRDAKAMKIRRQATPECMPAMPFETRLFNRRPNDISSQRFQIHRVPACIGEDKTSGWVAALRSCLSSSVLSCATIGIEALLFGRSGSIVRANPATLQSFHVCRKR